MLTRDVEIKSLDQGLSGQDTDITSLTADQFCGRLRTILNNRQIIKELNIYANVKIDFNNLNTVAEQFIAGLCYEFGNGVVPKNLDLAVKLYEGITKDIIFVTNDIRADAYNALGRSYQFGRGVAQDYQKAYQYYNKAKDLNHKAKFNLAMLYKGGLYVSQNMETAITLLQEALQDGNSKAAVMLGIIYKNGVNGIKQDHQKAVQYFIKAKNMGHVAGITQMAQYYQFGLCKDVNIDLDKAARLYKNAADQEYPDAAYWYAALCEKNGDFKTALEYYKKACNLGSAQAANNLGNFYYFGKAGLQRDYNEAARLYKIASKKEMYADPIINLARCTAKGQGVEKSYIKALQLYSKALVIEKKRKVAADDVQKTHNDLINIILQPLKEFAWYGNKSSVDKFLKQIKDKEDCQIVIELLFDKIKNDIYKGNPHFYQNFKKLFSRKQIEVSSLQNNENNNCNANRYDKLKGLDDEKQPLLQ